MLEAVKGCPHVVQTLGLFHLPIHNCLKHFLNVEGHCAAPGVPLPWDSQESAQEDDMPTQRLCALFMEKCDYSLQDFAFFRYTESEAAFVCRSVLSALSHLHARGIVHRDVKPANILVGSGGEKVLLGDFGLAAFLEVETNTVSRNGCGTHGFLAPECLEKNEFCEKSGDLGEHPFCDALMAAPHPHDTDLSAFHGYANFASWAAHGSFTKVKTLANAIHGKVILHRWMKPNGMEQDVVVKKMPRENVLQNQGKWTNESWSHRNPRSMHCPHPEDALTEIGVLSYLRQQEDLPLFLLRMMGSFTDGCNVFLVTELIQDGEVFQQVQDRHLDNSEGVLRQLMWQLLHAVRYLHHHDIGHRDISLENVLIAMPAEGRPPSLRLMDFGQAVRTRSRCRNVALRYFRTVGKPYYRSPEAYVPRSETVRVTAPAAAAAGDVMFLDSLGPTGAPDGFSCEVRLPADVRPGEPCDAEVWGYEVPPLDVFALGVCLFILAWRIPPWGQALRLDGTFQYIQAHGIRQLLTVWRLPLLSPEAMALLTEMMAANPQRRPSAEDCLASEWLRPLAEAQVPVHAAEDDVVDPAVAAMASMEIAAERRMVNWGDTWADDLRTAVRDIQETGYRITDAHGQQRNEIPGHPGQLEDVPLPSEFPLCVSVN